MMSNIKSQFDKVELSPALSGSAGDPESLRSISPPGASGRVAVL